MSWRNVQAVLFFRRRLAARARDFNWHNVIGIWCAIPLLFIVASGVVMSYPWANNLLYRWSGSEPPAQGRGPGRGEIRGDRAHRSGPGAGLGLAAADAVWQRAEQQIPGWRTITLRTPSSGHGPLTFTIDTGNGGRPDQRTQLTIDSRTGEPIRLEPFSSYNTGRRLRAWLRFLHTGEAGGMAGETFAGAASAGAALLVWTGICLAIRRLLRWKGRRTPEARAVETAQVSIQ
jgi:uncharacterized iron-regulated membrane protein